MATVLDYLEELDNQRDLLANFLTAQGVPAEESEKLNTLVPKVLEIASSGGLQCGAMIQDLHIAVGDAGLLEMEG